MRSWKRGIGEAAAWVVVVVAAAFLLFPFLWIGITSLKTNRELYDLSAAPLLIRQGVTLEHFELLLRRTAFLTWLRNSFLVSLSTTVVTLLASVPGAYALVRMSFPGQDTLGLAVFLAYLVPPSLLFVPLAQVVAAFGLMDTLWSLVVTYPTFTVPFSTWLLSGYLKGIPRELEESAMVDGASRLRALLTVVLPVATPGVVTVVLFAFTLSWGHMIYALAFVSRSTWKVLPVGLLTELVRGDVFYWGALMAGALASALPVLALYGVFTRYFVAGLTAGATKF
jgi:multiple sugar transport system permease protein